MKKSLGEIMSDPRIWEMSEEEKQRGRQRIMEIAKRDMESGMLTYKDEEPVMVHAPRVEMMPSPRRGIVGWFKDRLFGIPKKPQAVMVLDRHSQELLKEYMKNPEPLNNAVAACAVSAEDIKETTDRLITLARGHHIRNADGTITDVSDNPKCGFSMMKPIIGGQGTTLNRWPEELITDNARHSNCNYDCSRLYKIITDALLRRDEKPKNIPFKIEE